MPARIYLSQISTLNKYRNIPQHVDGFYFASKREAKRYADLKLLEAAGEIDRLVVDKKQLRWPLRVNGILIATYEADFQYRQKFGEFTWGVVVEDTKGVRTPVYRIKKKLMKALYGIEIKEV